jgi:hypothetical protein
MRLKEPSTQYVCLAEIAVFRSHEVWKEYQETRRQFRVTFTFTNSLGAAVPVTVAVTVVVPACGVSGWGVMTTVVPSKSVVPLSLKVVKSFDH